MNIKWFKGLTKEKKVEIKVDIGNAIPALKRLTVILQNELDSSVKEMASKEAFHTPSWPYKQAHYLGEQKALRDIIKLIGNTNGRK